MYIYVRNLHCFSINLLVVSLHKINKMFNHVQTWRAIRAMCTDSSLKEGHVFNHASNDQAVDYQQIVYE